MLQRPRVLTWLWWVWGSAPIVVLLGSLAIGYLRSSRAPELPATRDSIEAVVGLGFSALVSLPLAIAACYVDARSRSSVGPSHRWLVWLLLALVFPIGFWMFFTYLFGALGITLRSLTMAIFESV